jgi:hypothetical protein
MNEVLFQFYIFPFSFSINYKIVKKIFPVKRGISIAF